MKNLLMLAVTILCFVSVLSAKPVVHRGEVADDLRGLVLSQQRENALLQEQLKAQSQQLKVQSQQLEVQSQQLMLIENKVAALQKGRNDTPWVPTSAADTPWVPTSKKRNLQQKKKQDLQQQKKQDFSAYSA